MQTRQVWTPEYVCLDLDGAAVALSPVLAAARTATEGEGTEDDAAAALRMEAESKERQRTERRQVRELNKQAEVILSQLHCYCCDQDRFDADVSPTQPSIWSDLLLEILRRRVGQWALAGMASTTHRSSSGADRRSPSASLTCADFRSPRNEVCQDPDMAWFMIDPSNEKEIGAIAHGPVLLARVKGVTVGLRSIMAYSAGLEVAVTVVGSGIHAEAMRR
ncbi:MAG: hypothetical protein EOO27_19525 [Comamonadaceae bacterium]|nr:MAG: hypothetical protein EOO27_19525 [Comamonadaceae bacterium]